MPTISTENLTRLRTTRLANLLRLIVDTPPTIWSGRVNGAHASGATAIAVDGVVQVRAPQAHYLVLIGTTAGARDLGEARFISYSAPTLHLGAHNAPLPNNTYLTIVEFIPPVGILPTLDDNDITSEGGNVAYSDANTHYTPLARIGCPVVATRDALTGIATAPFYALPTAIAPGATIASHAWDFQDGDPATSTSPGTAGAPIEVEYSTAGRRYISYQCTDSNGKVGKRYVPVYIDVTPYAAVEVSGIEGDKSANTWKCSIKVMTDADESAFPPGAMITLYSTDYFGVEQSAIGGFWTHRESVKLVGYIQSGTIKANTLAGYVEFAVEGIGGVAGAIYAPAFSLEASASPTDWHQLAGLSYKLALHHLLTQHSTLSLIADVNLNIVDRTSEFFDFTEGSLAAQMSNLIDEGIGRQFWGSTAQGMLYFSPNPQLQAIADRPSTVVLETTLADFRDEIDLGAEEFSPQTAQVDLCADDGVENTFFSLAPATPHANARGTIKKVDNALCATQDEANELAGLVLAYENAPYKQVVLPWRGAYTVFDPFVVEPLLVNLPAALNQRGVEWVDQVCWVTRVSYEYRAGALLVTTVVEKDSLGVAGIGIPGDMPTVIPTPIGGPPTTWIYPPVVPPGLPPGTLGAASLVYDLNDGYAGTIAPSSSYPMFYFPTDRRFRIRGITAYCADIGVTLELYLGSNASPSIWAHRDDDGSWIVRRYNGATGILISSWTAPSTSATLVRAFAGTDVLDIPSTGTLFRTVVSTGEGAIGAVGYGFMGSIY